MERIRPEDSTDYYRPSKNFLSHIGTPYVSSYMAYAISELELVPTWLKVLTWSGTFRIFQIVSHFPDYLAFSRFENEV